MSIWKTLFGAPEIIQRGLDLIDAMHTSTEEEILAKNQARITLLQAYAPFKIAQRYLALIFSGAFISSFLLVLAMTLSGQGNISDVRGVIEEFYIGWIMLTIVGFYFGGGAFEGILNARKTRP